MKIAVVTPTFRTPEAVLKQCVDSVWAQSRACTHILVADGDEPVGLPPHDERSQLIRLPKAHGDVGNAGRAIGSVSAICQGFDAIAYLDADNWFDPDHLASMVQAHETTGAAVCSSTRKLWQPDGAWLGICPEVDGESFVDTNCLFLTRAAFATIAAWYLAPESLKHVGDRVLWNTVKSNGLTRHHVRHPSVNYRTRYASHYRHFGKQPPVGAKHNLLPEEFSSLSSQPLPRHSGNGPGNGTRPRVSLCMIVRNEEANLDACLKSIASIVDEIILVDSGSTDRTVEIGRSYGAKIVPFEWIDDFSAARNESLRHATGDYLLWLDADESFDDENRRRLLALFGKLKFDDAGYLLRQWSLPESPGGSALVVDQVRLFRILPNVAWKHRLHEQILPSLQDAGCRIVQTDIVFRHIGYSDASLREQKLVRNTRIIEREAAEDPTNPFTLFNLANVHLDRGDPSKAIECLERCLERCEPTTSFLPKVHVLLSQTHRALGDSRNAWAVCEKGVGLFADSLEIRFEEGLVRHARKDFEGARRCFEHTLSMPRKSCFVGVDPAIQSVLAHHHLAVAAMALGDDRAAEKAWRAALAANPAFGPASLGLIEILFKRGNKEGIEEVLASLKEHKADPAIVTAAQARLRAKEGDYPGACRILEESLDQCPRTVWLRVMLSDLHLRDGRNRDAAERQLEQAIAIAPNNLDVRRRIARLRKNAKSHG